MAAPGVRMRLTVEVLPLEAENAHGPFAARAVAAFNVDLKARKFALPVRAQDTFEIVWAQIEKRYKKNYLDPQQAASFTIKKLQDAYDCDLDLGDTVNDIFEGENDPAMRVIKVVPSYIDRAFSVPPTSNLRPVNAQKRIREINEEHANKRRRLQQLNNIQEESETSYDQPIPSTESEPSRQATPRRAPEAQADTRARRSQTGGSLMVVEDAQTGHVEFGSSLKRESPEPGMPSQTASQALEHAPPAPTNGTDEQASVTPVAPEQDGGRDVHMQSEPSPSQEAIHRSPQPTPLEAQPSPQPQQTPPSAQPRRKDVYEVPSSPEFMKGSAKSKKTYSRSPRTATTVRKEVDLLNSSRALQNQAQTNSEPHSTPGSLSKARAFKVPEPDDIESTTPEPAGTDDADLTTSFLDNAGLISQGNPKTPAKRASIKSTKPGSLKKPLKWAQNHTQDHRDSENNRAHSSQDVGRVGSTPRKSAEPGPSSNSEARKIDPDIQARLDKVSQLRMQRLSASQPVASPKLRPQQLGSKSSPAGKARSDGSPDLHKSDKPKRDSSTPLQNGTSTKSTSNPPVQNDGAVFKKPALKTRAQTEAKANNTPQTRRTSGSSDPRGTPLRSETPSDVNRPTSAGQDGSHQRNSNTSDSGRSSSHADTSIPNDAQLTPIPVPVKRRGRPPKNPATQHTPTKSDSMISKLKSSPVAGSAPPAKRGRPKKSPQDSSSQPAAPSTQPEAKTRSSIQSSQKSPPAVEIPEDAIVISSGESSADTSAESDLEETTQQEAVARNNSKSTQPSAPPPASEPLTMNATDLQPATEIDESRSTHGTSKNNKPIEDAAPSAPAKPWHDQGTWGFDRLNRPNGSVDNITKDTAPATIAKSPTPVVGKGLHVGDEVEDEGVADVAEGARSESRSPSAAVSTRSSPAVTRRPARFLSHSPTPGSEDESDGTSSSASKATTPQMDGDKDDSDSDSSSESNNSESEQEDTEMPDAEIVTTNGTTEPHSNIPPSSPPIVNDPPASTARVPASSQLSSQTRPVVQRTPVPLPPNLSQGPPSSQSVSAQAAARRPNARYAGFRTLREQLADAKTTPTQSQKKTYDPRLLDLSKLAKGKSPTAMGVGLDDDSSDESSSSSSSDSD